MIAFNVPANTSIEYEGANELHKGGRKLHIFTDALISIKEIFLNGKLHKAINISHQQHN